MADAIQAAGGRAMPGRWTSAGGRGARGFAEAREAFGGLDLLVNNAGLESPLLLVDMPLDEWERVIKVNLTGVFLCPREAARIMVADSAPGRS